MPLEPNTLELIEQTRVKLQAQANARPVEEPCRGKSSNVTPADARIEAEASETHEIGACSLNPCHPEEGLLEQGQRVAAELGRPLESNPLEIQLPPEIAQQLEVQRLKYHPALQERWLEAMRNGDPEARANAIAALQDLDGYAALSKEIHEEAQALADTWLSELERFVLGEAKYRIVRAVAVMMLEARLWSYGGAEHFFCTQDDIAALSGLSLRSVQRHLSKRNPRAHLLARWLSSAWLYGTRITGETSRLGTVYRFRLEGVALDCLEPCPKPRLEALKAPWRSSDDLPGFMAASEEIEALETARYRPDGTPVLDDTRQKTARNTPFPLKAGKAGLERAFQLQGLKIEGIHLNAVVHKPLNSYTRQNRLHHQLEQNMARTNAGREPLAALEGAQLSAELIAVREGRHSSQYATALQTVERRRDEWAMAVLPMPRLGAFKVQDEALEKKARAVVSRLGDHVDSVPFWKSVFKQAGNDGTVFKIVSDTLEADKNGLIRETMPKYAVGMLKRAKIIRGAAQAQLLEPTPELEHVEIRL